MRLSRGPKGNVAARKRWRKEWRVEERVRNERGKGTCGEGGWRVRAREELFLWGKGRAMEKKEQGGTRGLEKRNWRRVKERDEVTRMRTRG